LGNQLGKKNYFIRIANKDTLLRFVIKRNTKLSVKLRFPRRKKNEINILKTKAGLEQYFEMFHYRLIQLEEIEKKF